MMSTATATNVVPSPPGILWFPGKADHTAVVPLSERALAIARAREELLGLLRDVEESDYELSFTDLVERGPGPVDGSGVNETTAAAEPETATATEALHNLRERNKSKNSRRSSSSSRSSSDGVLLNIYMPTSVTRSLTVSRARRGSGRESTGEENKR